MSDSYAVPTEILLGATGASTPDDPVDLISHPFPILRNPLCVGSDAEWVPDHEAGTVPGPMAELCLACECRQQCLLWALLEDAPGYWAATTTRARREAHGDLQSLLENPTVAARSTTHPVGAGTVSTYRAGCDCDECRGANARAKADQRQRAKERRVAAALVASTVSAA